MKSSIRKKFLAILLISCILIEPIIARRSGGGHSRGSSAGRSGGFGGSRPRTGSSGTGGSHHNTGGSSYPRGNYGVGSHSNTGTGGGLFNRQQNNRQGNSGGGFFNRQNNQGTSRFNKGSGIGSMVRSNTFKNAIVGAAAGYLLYQGGKHLIRSAMAPMMWNNRPYYWGSNYYQQRPGMAMCRMPIQSGDPQFGNIYFNDNTRPREITWGCGYGEQCCGYECCPSTNYGGGNYGSGYGQGGYYRNNSFRNFGFGSLLVLILISCGAGFVVYRVCNRRSNSYQRAAPQAY